jgi:hypothetical protein
MKWSFTVERTQLSFSLIFHYSGYCSSDIHVIFMFFIFYFTRNLIIIIFLSLFFYNIFFTFYFFFFTFFLKKRYYFFILHTLNVYHSRLDIFISFFYLHSFIILFFYLYFLKILLHKDRENSVLMKQL